MAKDKNTQPSSMMSVLANLRKSFGNDALFSGDDEILATADPISTGSYALDAAIGIGGVPRGRITQLAGAEGSGKTLLALQIVKNWQAQHPENWGLWIDAEFSLNQEWAKTLGVDMSRLMVLEKNLGSTVFNYLCGIPNPKDPAKKAKTGFLDDLIAQGDANRCGVIVLDSVAAVEPPVAASYEVGHQNMAAMARFLSQAIPRLLPLINEANVAFVAINQLRMDPSVQYGNPETSPGGKAWKHYCRLMINFKQVMAKDELILDAKEKKIGHVINAKIQKNSFAIPTDTKFAIKYLDGVVNHNIEMVELGIDSGVIQRPNNVMYVYGDQKWKGRETVEEAFRDPKLFSEVWEKVKIIRATRRPVETQEYIPVPEEDLEE